MIQSLPKCNSKGFLRKNLNEFIALKLVYLKTHPK